MITVPEEKCPSFINAKENWAHLAEKNSQTVVRSLQYLGYHDNV